MFEGDDYAFWSIIMKNYLMFIGLDVWALVLREYKVPKAIPLEAEDKKKLWEHAKALNTLQVGLSKKVLAKVLTCDSEKQLWDKLENLYVGDSKVKREKLQTLKEQFEGISSGITYPHTANAHTLGPRDIK